MTIPRPPHQRRPRRQGRRLLAGAALTAGALGLAAPPAPANVTGLTARAFAARTDVSIFNSPSSVIGPRPLVELSGEGQLSDGLPELTLSYGPAVIYNSGPVAVSVEGTEGRGGSTTASVDITGAAPEDRPGPLLYDGIRSTCSATEAEVTSEVAIDGGTLVTSTDDEGEPATTVAIPANPEPNTEMTGTIDNIGDSYRIVFNEVVTEGGVTTARAVHYYLLGPSGKGDAIIGEVACGVASDGANLDAAPGASTTSAPAATDATASTLATEPAADDGGGVSGALVAGVVVVVLAGAGAAVAASRRRRAPAAEGPGPGGPGPNGPGPDRPAPGGP